MMEATAQVICGLSNSRSDQTKSSHIQTKTTFYFLDIFTEKKNTLCKNSNTGKSVLVNE